MVSTSLYFIGDDMYLFKLVNLDPARLSKLQWILQSGIVNSDCWLAGGALRTLIDSNEKIVDYDLFFKRRSYPSWDSNGSHYDVLQTKNKLINLGFKCTFECPEGKLYTYEIDLSKPKMISGSAIKHKVQLITEHFYSSPEELLSTFDLSPCYFVTDGEYLWTNKLAIKSVKKKICCLNNLTYPVSSFKRIIKYYDKGYSCLPAIQSYVDNLIQSNASKFTQESMRVYID